MPERYMAEKNTTKLVEGRMELRELANWYDKLMPKLRIVRGVRNATDEFRSAVLESLFEYGYTKSHAVLAEHWLARGRWNEYRATGVVLLVDFFPTREQLQTLGDVEPLIASAARKIVAELARREYIHRARVEAMLDEVRIAAATEARCEYERHNELKWQMLLDCQTNRMPSMHSKKRAFTWQYHPRFKNKFVLHSTKRDV